MSMCGGDAMRPGRAAATCGDQTAKAQGERCAAGERGNVEDFHGGGEGINLTVNLTLNLTVHLTVNFRPASSKFANYQHQYHTACADLHAADSSARARLGAVIVCCQSPAGRCRRRLYSPWRAPDVPELGAFAKSENNANGAGAQPRPVPASNHSKLNHSKFHSHVYKHHGYPHSTPSSACRHHAPCRPQIVHITRAHKPCTQTVASIVHGR